MGVPTRHERNRHDRPSQASGNIVGPAANSQTQGIYQTGSGDSLNVTQSGTADTFDGNDAKTGSVVQTGSANGANVTQSGTSSTVHLSNRARTTARSIRAIR